jgi:threonine/homoserine/homoserine lactone efflux protein
MAGRGHLGQVLLYPARAGRPSPLVSIDLIPFLAVTGLVMAVPGPSVLFAVTHRLRGGPAAGVSAVLGLESGLTIHLVAAILGISSVVAASESLLLGLQVLGSVYLAVLGVQLLRSAPGHGSGAEVREGRARIFLAGLLVDLLNPKTVLYFVALLPQFIDSGSGSVVQQSLVLGGCVVGLAVLFDGGYAALAGRLQHRGLPAWIPVWANRAAGCSFLGLAVVALAG